MPRRDPASVTLPGVIPLRLDVTRPDEVAAAACGDISRQVKAGLNTQPPSYAG